jgi:hypothetical protein
MKRFDLVLGSEQQCFACDPLRDGSGKGITTVDVTGLNDTGAIAMEARIWACERHEPHVDSAIAKHIPTVSWK